MPLKGPEVKQLTEALSAAFSPEELKQKLLYDLNKRLEALVPPNLTWPGTVFELVTAADRQGWIAELRRLAVPLSSEEIATDLREKATTHDASPQPDQVPKFEQETEVDVTLSGPSAVPFPNPVVGMRPGQSSSVEEKETLAKLVQ